MVIVAAPSYLRKRIPPQSREDFLKHDCVALRLATAKGIYGFHTSVRGSFKSTPLTRAANGQTVADLLGPPEMLFVISMRKTRMEITLLVGDGINSHHKKNGRSNNADSSFKSKMN